MRRNSVIFVFVLFSFFGGNDKRQWHFQMFEEYWRIRWLFLCAKHYAIFHHICTNQRNMILRFFLFDSLFFYCLKRKMYGKFMVVLSHWWCHLFILAPWISKYAIFDCEKRFQLTEAFFCALAKIFESLFLISMELNSSFCYNAHTFSPF